MISKSPTIYTTLITMWAIYVLVGVWCWREDGRDEERTGLRLLLECSELDAYVERNYFYELKVFKTESRSSVHLEVFGESGETGRIRLCSRLSEGFGGVAFLLAAEGCLGTLEYMDRA